MGEDPVRKALVLDIRKESVVVPVELLDGESSYDIPSVIFVIHASDHSVGVLGQSLPAHEVGLLQGRIGQAELLEFVVRAELLIVSVAVGVMCSQIDDPVFGRVHCKRKDIVVLPEIVCGPGPIGAVPHRIAFRRILSFRILDEEPVRTRDQIFIKTVEPT